MELDTKVRIKETSEALAYYAKFPEIKNATGRTGVIISVNNGEPWPYEVAIDLEEGEDELYSNGDFPDLYAADELEVIE